MSPLTLAGLFLFVFGICYLVLIAFITAKNDIQQSIEREKLRKFNSKGDPVARKYGMTVLIMLGASPFVWALLGYTIKGELLINHHPLGFIIIYLGIGLGLVKLYELIKNKS